jgi:hypothetical protein
LTVFDKQGQNTMGLDSKAGHVKKGGAVEEYFEFLLPSEPERDEWLAAVRAAMPEVTGSVYTGEAKQGVIHMQNARHKWKARHCTLSSSGFVTSDSMEGTIPMRLIADSQEEKDAWIVAMRWLEGNCDGPPPRKDPRMYPVGKNGLFAPFVYIKFIILPRQARDKHRENSKKSGVSLVRVVSRHALSRVWNGRR